MRVITRLKQILFYFFFIRLSDSVFSFSFGRTLGRAHARHQKSRSLLSNWKNNLSVPRIIFGFVFIFISSLEPHINKIKISFCFFSKQVSLVKQFKFLGAGVSTFSRQFLKLLSSTSFSLNPFWVVYKHQPLTRMRTI